MSSSSLYSGTSWTQLSQRPQAFGDGLYDDLPLSDWLKVILECTVIAVIVCVLVKKVIQQRVFGNAINMSDDVKANLSPEQKDKVKQASGLGIGGSLVAGAVGLMLLLIMWFL